MRPAPGSVGPALHFRDRYTPDAPPALSGVELVIHSGDIVAVVGRNGSGEEHSGSAGERPPAPSVRMRSRRITRDDGSLRFIRARVGIVFQDPDSQIVGSSVGDDVAFGLENLGVPRMEMQMRVAAVWRWWGSRAWSLCRWGSCRGAKRQRLAIAGLGSGTPRPHCG